jgi:hypothetical protein
LKQKLAELSVWCLITISALLLMVIWAIDALTGNLSGHVVAVLSNDFPFTFDWVAYEYNGSLVAYASPNHDPAWAIVLSPPTLFGLIACWSPVIALLGIGLLAPAFAMMPTLGKPLRWRIPVPRVRLTIFRLMVVTGMVSTWLWLGRFDPYTRLIGTLVVGFMLHAGFRRSFLANRAKTDATHASALSRAGIAGYSLVLVLALAWVAAILVWDSYSERP